MHKKTIENYIEKIENSIPLYVPKSNTLQNNIYEAMLYSLNAGGKRIRPMLTLEFAKITGGNIESAMPVAVAIEMIHTYSLIHDDLPCMDNDDYRRGKLTNHKVYGEALAVLAGDALLNQSIETIVNYADELDEMQKLSVISLIYKNSGASGMIGGQVIDMEYEGKECGIDVLMNMHTLKTGALFKASCMAGCICSSSYNMTVYAEKFAHYIGLAFQITDDILDVTGDFKLLGKPVNSDTNNSKSTFVSILGIEKAKEKAKEYIKLAKEQLKMFDNTELLEYITDSILERKK